MKIKKLIILIFYVILIILGVLFFERITLIIATKEKEIENFMETLPISDIRITFYKTILKERKKKILEKALELNKNIENDIEYDSFNN